MNDLQLARAAAREGASAIRRIFGHLTSVDYKGKVNPVTAADRESEERIQTLVSCERPDDAFLGEEAGGRIESARRMWIVDPLDGTVNFVHGVPHVAVSVALYEQGQPLVGVVLDVFRQEEFHAVAGGGAWSNDRRLIVSPTKTLNTAIVATGFPYDRRERADEYARTLGAVLARIQGLRRMGTASLDLAWVAAGRYDAFWEQKLGPWDVAAGLLLVREAGGIVTNRESEPSTPHDEHFIASNASLHDEWRRLIDHSLAEPRVDSAS
ncbi:MAG: inositol monophosphatase [Gammaproteobacteria bacterium]|nr:inositol monophosphatase [Gammaproteobacteria bacterium]